MSKTNNHHLFWPRNQWKPGHRQRLRNHELAVVEMDVDWHNKLHHDLRKVEMCFYPRIRTVMGMYALAEYQRTNDMSNELEDITDRIRQWHDICMDNNDTDSAYILRKQIPYIERGHHG